jgi:hypothetical protein
VALNSINKHFGIIVRDDNLAKVMLRNVNNIRWLLKQVTCNKYQQAFLAPLPGTRFNSVLSSDAKECQQAFLAPLSGKVVRQEGILINFYLLM